MKHVTHSDVVKLYNYASRDGFLYARAFQGSGYGKFLKSLEKKMRKGELTLEQAFGYVDDFKPLHQAREVSR